MTVVRFEYGDDVSLISATENISRINILKYTHVVKRILYKNKGNGITNFKKLLRVTLKKALVVSEKKYSS